MRVALIALLLVSFLNMHAAGAEAQVSPDWERRALETAQRVWHPTCGQLRLSFETPPAGIEKAEFWSEWAWANDCTVRVNKAQPWLGYPDFCDTVLHGAGHAAGMGHSDHGIMRPTRQAGRSEGTVHRHGRAVTIVRWTGVDRRCLRGRVRSGNAA